MGCFLSCFRGGPDQSGNLRDPLVRESRLGDAFLNDEKKSEATARLDADNGAGVDEELRREANYLKSCGAISQTPPEILEVPVPINSEDANECNDASTNVQLMNAISQTSPEILEVPIPIDSEDNSECNDAPTDVQLINVISQTPPEILEVPIPINPEDTNECNDTLANVQLMKDATLVEQNFSEVINSDKKDRSSHEQNPDESTLGLEPQPQSSLQDKPLCQNVRDQSTYCSDSPYPTPLVIRGDIQTPGTVYGSYKESAKPGKRARASRQFIYPVLRPIENKLQWMELKAESPVLSSNPPKRRNLSADPSEKAQQTCAGSTVTETESESFPFHDNSAAQDEVLSPEEPKGQNVNQLMHEDRELPKQGSEHGKLGVSSLSHWLKPSPADDGKEPYDDNETSLFDVPIFPAFGLNWENDDPTPVLPKAWDGNGIPNTTTKYKEDQKVNWHATPFEERLMKVLSDEKPPHERKISGKLIHLEENSE